MSKGIKLLNKKRTSIPVNECFCTTKETVKQIKKELKALEIIKEKDVRIYTIKNMGLSCDGYNRLVINDSKRLTQEEYDLLEEILKA